MVSHDTATGDGHRQTHVLMPPRLLRQTRSGVQVADERTRRFLRERPLAALIAAVAAGYFLAPAASRV